MAICLLSAFCTYSQDSLSVDWRVKESAERVVQSLPGTTASDPSSFAREVVGALHQRSYLAASMDSMRVTATTLECHLFIGPKFTWSHLELSSVPPLLRDAVNPSDRRNRPFSNQELLGLYDRLLAKAAENGYPFASVRLDSLSIDSNSVAGQLHVNLNQKIIIERIRLEGDLKISPDYLAYFLDVKPGDIFDRRKITDISTRLSERPFIKVLKEPTVTFLGNGATLNLVLDRKPANQFDILLGLLPSPIEGRRFQVTGNVNVTMENQFGAGERFHMNFESLQPQTQELELDLTYPFIFDLPFGADLAFDLYRRDSTFIDIDYEVGLEYFLTPRTRIKFFLENTSSRLLSVNRQRIISSRTLPDNLDIKRNTLGLGIIHSKLNYRFNPRKGRSLQIRIGAGLKKIRKNETISGLEDPTDPDFDFNSLYNNLELENFQYDIRTEFDFYLPIFTQSTIKFSSRSGLLGSGGQIYQNELYRIGGTKLLRGFNEESLFVNAYSVSTVEYRLLFNQNSNIFLFSDLGIIRRQLGEVSESDTPIGIGTGINLETPVGIFGISYAIGKQKNIPFSFREGRIHFGMVSLF